MSEAGAAPLEPRTSEEGGSCRGNTGTRSAPHPHQSGLRSDTMVLLGPPACKWEGLGHRKGSIPLLNCWPLSHSPSPASVSPCVRRGVPGPWLYYKELCRTRVPERPRPASLCVRADNGPAAELSSRPRSPPPPSRAAGILGSWGGKAASTHCSALLPRRRPTGSRDPLADANLQVCRTLTTRGLEASAGRRRRQRRRRAGRAPAAGGASGGGGAAPSPRPSRAPRRSPRCRPGRSGSRARGGGAGGGRAREARAGTSSLHCWATFATTRRAAASARRRRRCRRRLPAARARAGRAGGRRAVAPLLCRRPGMS